VTPRLAPWPSVFGRVAAWSLPVLLGAYILYATIDWEVPQPGGIRFGPLWLVATVLGGLGWFVSGRRFTPVAVMALGSVAGMVLTDITAIVGQNLRDLHLYVRAGDHFLRGEPVYLDRLFTVRPADLSTYPFLYPPATLPFFAVLARLPQILVDVVWLGASIGAGYATLRAFGVRGAWIVILLVWPPFFQGIQVGNVAVFAGLLFAIAPRWGGGLVVAAIFKLYSGIAAAWLIREGRVRQLVVGVVVVLAISAVTLPLTGVDRWREWLTGLDWYRASQPLLPASLYGLGLPRYVPFAVFVVGAVLVVLAALGSRGVEALGRFGIATIVASPSLYAHGLIVAVPALFRLDAASLWLAVGITSVAPGIGWWLAIGLVVGSWFVPALRRSVVEEPASTLTWPATSGTVT
jgi:hypothetical protein